MDLSQEVNFSPIFLCGVQRAGTTLLVKMLDRGGRVKFLPQETHFYPLFWSRKNQFAKFNSPTDLSVFLKENLPKVNYGWTTSETFLQELTSAIVDQKFMPKSATDLLDFVLNLWNQNNQGKYIVGEKTPGHIFYKEQLIEKYPNAKLIAMCRDPRGAALSELIKLNNNPRVERQFNVFTFIVRWSTAVAAAEDLVARKKGIFLKYEDLISTPEEEVRSVTNYLDIPFEKDMLNVGVTNSSFQDKKQKGIKFNSQNLNRWESELPLETIALIEYHLESQMKKLNYVPIAKDKINGSSMTILKQKAKLKIARQFAKSKPALFHHLNRNKKYKIDNLV